MESFPYSDAFLGMHTIKTDFVRIDFEEIRGVVFRMKGKLDQVLEVVQSDGKVYQKVYIFVGKRRYCTLYFGRDNLRDLRVHQIYYIEGFVNAVGSANLLVIKRILEPKNELPENWTFEYDPNQLELF